VCEDPSSRSRLSLFAIGPPKLLSRAARCMAAGAIVLTAGACTSPVARATRDAFGARVVRATRGVQDTRSVLRVRAVPRVPAGRAVRAVLAAWKSEIEAFYAASALGDPSYRRLGQGVVPGSPRTTG